MANESVLGSAARIQRICARVDERQAGVIAAVVAAEKGATIERATMTDFE
jgi:hypothetical protein